MPSYTLFADYFQFYLQDECADGNLGDAWTDTAVNDLLALAPGTIGVGTVRNMDVPVEVEILDGPPQNDLAQWDHVMECGIVVPSGRLVIAGCTDYFPDAARLNIASGTYRARIYYGDLDSLREDGLTGDDHYRIVLWPSNDLTRNVIKRRVQS